MAVVPQITAALSVGPEDVLRPSAWLGSTMVASLQLLDNLRRPASASGVTVVFRRPDGVEIAVVGEPSEAIPAPPRWLGACELSMPGSWAVRGVSLNPMRVVDWILFDVVEEPQEVPAPYAALWLQQDNQVVSTTTGGLISAARIDQLPARPVADGDKFVGVGADGASVQVDYAGIKQGATDASLEATRLEVEPLVDQAALSEEIATGAADIAMTKASEAASSATQADAARGAAREAVEAAAAEAMAAEAASTTASAAAAAALAGSTIYATVDLGLAAVAEGGSFNVATAGDPKVIVYRKTGGLAVYVTQIASQASVDMIPARLIQTPDGGFFFGYEDGIAVLYSIDGNGTWVYPGACLDVATIPGLRRRDGKSGFTLLDNGMDANGVLVSVEADGSALLRNRDGSSQLRLVPAGGGVNVAGLLRAGRVAGEQITVGDSFNISQLLSSSSQFLLPVVDAEGVVIGGLQHDGTWYGGTTAGGGSNPTSVTSDDLVRLDAYCASLGADFMARRRMSSYAGLLYGHNLTVALGQSLSLGVYSEALISTLARLGIYMVGDSVNSVGDASASWAPVGGVATLKRLLLTAIQSSNRGETISAAALDHLRRCWLRSAHLLEDDSIKQILMCAGVGGQGLVNLTKGGAYYPKVLSAWAAAQTAVGPGVPINLLDFDFIHGESDARGVTGGVNNFDVYKAGVEQYYADLCADLCPNQELKPVMYVQQVSGGYLRDGNRMAVAMAQLAICDANPWAVFTGPYYRVPNHISGHLYSNGSRWRGMAFGKAKENVLLKNQAHRSFAPWFVLDRGTTLIIGANPRGAMKIAAPWVSSSQSTPPYQMAVPASLGLEVFDDAGAIGVTSVTFQGNLIVIQMSRARFSAEATLDVRYGGEAFIGNGFICDSDEAISSQRYVSATSATGNEIIPELDGKPYPGENSLAHFHLTSRPF